MDEMCLELSQVPAVFTLKLLKPVAISRVQMIKPALRDEVETLINAPDKYEQDSDELLQALDLLTWLEYTTGSPQKAIELNDRALALTQNKAAFTLGNRAHLMWCQGNLEQTRCCLDSLAALSQDSSTDDQLAAVKAHQAYCYFRLRGSANLSQAAALFEEALNIKPNSYLWRLQAGIVYKRITHLARQNRPHGVEKPQTKKAMDYFQCVAEQSSNARLRAFAYSDLAYLVSIKREGKHIVREYCDKALSLCDNHQYVLQNCGKSLKEIKDTPKALKLLTQATAVCPTSNIFCHLGNCLQAMGQREMVNPYSLDHYYNEAEKSYCEGIRLSPTNLANRFSLARLLRVRGKLEEAAIEFKRLISVAINSQEDGDACMLMKSYEQAALCQLELSKDCVAAEPSPIMNLNLMRDAEKMLMKALELAFDALTPVEREMHLKDAGYLRSLFACTNPRELSAALEMICKVYDIAHEPERKLEAVREFLNHVSDDPAVVTLALEKYLDCEDYEIAYVMLQMADAFKEPPAIDDALFTKVMLSAAKARLQQCSGEVSRIFKAHFDHHRLQHRRQGRHHYEGNGEQSDTVDSASVELLDVLIVYDGSHDEHKGKPYFGDICGELQEAMSTVFGLNVSHNMQVSFFHFHQMQYHHYWRLSQTFKGYLFILFVFLTGKAPTGKNRISI